MRTTVLILCALFLTFGSSLAAPIASLTLVQSGNNVTLAWDSNGNLPGTNYWVYRSSSSGVYSSSERRNAGELTTFQWLDLPYGTSYFVVTAYGGGQESGYSNEVSVNVPAPVLTLACPAITNGIVGTAFNASFVVAGGVPPYVVSIITGQLPPGLILDNATGAIIGTPTTPGTYAIQAQVSDLFTSPPAICSCTFVIKPATPSGLTITSGPTAQILDKKTVLIAWQTSIAADSEVRYSRMGSRGSGEMQNYIPSLVTNHSVSISTTPNQDWTYQISSRDNQGHVVTANGNFTTR